MKRGILGLLFMPEGKKNNVLSSLISNMLENSFFFFFVKIS